MSTHAVNARTGRTGQSSRSRRPRLAPTSRHFRIAAWSLLALTIYGSLIPFSFFYRPFDDALSALLQLTLIPASLLEARGDWIISGVQFTVFGFLALGAAAVDRSRRHTVVAAIMLTPLCVFLAVVIEFLQVYFPPRTVSLNDIVVESAGSLAGIVSWLVCGDRVTKWLRGLSAISNTTGLARRLLPAYVLLILIVHLMPFDLVIDRHELRTKYAEGKIQLLPFERAWSTESLIATILNIACFLPVGFLDKSALEPRQRRGPAIPWRTLGLPLLTEFLQLFVYSRTFNACDIFTGTLGVLVGSWLTGVVLPQAPKPSEVWFRHFRFSIARVLMWSGMIVCWLGLVVYFNWQPFNFSTHPVDFANDPDYFDFYGMRRMALAPFVDYYWGSKYNALDQFIRKGLSFFPLGAFFAFAAPSIYGKYGTRRLIACAAIFGVAIEIGQYFLPERTPSTTDVLIGCIGAVAGYWFIRYVRATFWAESILYQSLPVRLRADGEHHEKIPPPVDKPTIAFVVFR